MSALRLLLLPFAWLYGSVLVVRHALYNSGLRPRTRPTIPTIVVGNIALGGTGKTPHVELLLRMVQHLGTVATLSRGYGRQGTEIREVQATDSAYLAGDEPLQLKVKFPAVRVFVGADRVKAIAEIERAVPQVKAVVLDDAFQHRRLDAGLNILLTTWHRPYCNDRLLPAGRLRDLPSRAQAAQVVVVTKCPALPTAAEQAQWRQRLRLLPQQQLFFSGIAYDAPRTTATGHAAAPDTSTTHGLLVTGIADPAPLVAHVKGLFGQVDHVAFADHHAFTPADLQRLAERFSKFAPGPKMLVTTEKDAMRLRSVIDGSPLVGLPIAVIAIKAVILNEPERFAALIRDHVATYPAHR